MNCNEQMLSPDTVVVGGENIPKIIWGAAESINYQSCLCLYVRFVLPQHNQ